jgi:glycerol-3-phosphate dehydrogenase
LVKAKGADEDNTKTISREHTILMSRSGLVTVTGGKWTTYRAMAEDVLDKCAAKGLLPPSSKGLTTHLKLVGAERPSTPGRQSGGKQSISLPPGMHSYGDEQAMVADMPGADLWLCEGLSEAMVRFAARYEYAITVEDVLARRSRLLFLDARLATSVAAQVGAILQHETGLNPEVAAFLVLAQQYLHLPQ